MMGSSMNMSDLFNNFRAAVGEALALAALAAFVFHLPVYQVYICVIADEFAKFLIGMRRYTSRRWIHNLAKTVST